MFLTQVRAGSEDRSPWGGFWFEPVAGARTASGTRVTTDSALSLPVVLACVRVLSESFSVLPLRLYQKTATGRSRITDHWLYDLIGRRPNAYQTPFEWREMMQGHLALRGNCYNRIVSDRRGNITDLMPLHPDRIKIEYTESSTSEFDYRYRYTDRTGLQSVLTRGEVWQIRGLSSDGIMGLSPITLARESVGMGLAAQEYGARFFQNDAKPGIWIEFPGSFKDKPARDTFRESFQDAQTGNSRGKAAVMENGMKIHELGVTNKDSQFLEARQFQVSDIARMFRVPPHLVGDLSKATFSNIEQQSLDFVIHTMTPWAERWESSIETTLLLQDEAGIEAEFDFTGLLRGDQAARGAFYHNGIMDGWMTRNEARESEGREPLDGLDEPLRPLNMVEESDAPDELAETVAPTAPAAPPDGNADDANAARMALLLRGNAARMARRIAAGTPPAADVLADALAVTAAVAATWLENNPVCHDEDGITQSLMELAQ
jgi:HK97 family phage portal protein